MLDTTDYDERDLTILAERVAKLEHQREALSTLYDDAKRASDVPAIRAITLRQKVVNGKLAKAEDDLVNTMALQYEDAGC